MGPLFLAVVTPNEERPSGPLHTAPKGKYRPTGARVAPMSEESPSTPPSPAAEPAAPPSADPETPPKEDWETRFKYLLADFENFRKRSDREREALRQQVRAQVLRELLPILEAFEQARKAVDRKPLDDPLRQGIDLLGVEWEKFLRANGLEPVARLGGRFSAEDQEAVGEAPVSAKHPGGSVVEIVQQGFRAQGVLLRPAKVVVARATAGSAARRPIPAPESAAQPIGEDAMDEGGG
jgi:molecular chaperone GrpE